MCRVRKLWAFAKHRACFIPAGGRGRGDAVALLQEEGRVCAIDVTSPLADRVETALQT